jgi:hypothetical protein
MSIEEKKGHRQRLRDRFLKGDAEARSDEALLELLLTYAIPRKNVQPIARELIRIFGSAAKALNAPPDALGKVKGLGLAAMTLLKVVHALHGVGITSDATASSAEGEAPGQIPLFGGGADESEPKGSPMGPKDGRDQKPLPEAPAKAKPAPRKLQVSRSHLFESNHFSRVLSFLLENRAVKKISRDTLVENSGLPDGQVASLISIGAALGLIQIRSQTLTPIGIIIAAHDLFLEGQGTLEWCHYKGAGSYENYLWFDVFNHLLVHEPAMSQEGWQQYFRDRLQGEYAAKTIKDHVPKEIRFLVDAYLNRDFSRLQILQISTNDELYRRRYTSPTPIVLAAMIYDMIVGSGSQLAQVGELAETPGSPAMVFGMDTAVLRQQIEGLHDRGWLRYETTHNLDQIRLKVGYTAIEFLLAHYENRDPQPTAA